MFILNFLTLNIAKHCSSTVNP